MIEEVRWHCGKDGCTRTFRHEHVKRFRKQGTWVGSAGGLEEGAEGEVQTATFGGEAARGEEEEEEGGGRGSRRGGFGSKAGWW